MGLCELVAVAHIACLSCGSTSVESCACAMQQQLMAGSALRVQLGSFASSLTRLEYTQRLDSESLSRSIVSAHQEATTD